MYCCWSVTSWMVCSKPASCSGARPAAGPAPCSVSCPSSRSRRRGFRTSSGALEERKRWSGGGSDVPCLRYRLQTSLFPIYPRLLLLGNQVNLWGCCVPRPLHSSAFLIPSLPPSLRALCNVTVLDNVHATQVTIHQGPGVKHIPSIPLCLTC